MNTVCKHVLAYANRADAEPCPVCERDSLRAQLATSQARLVEVEKEREEWAIIYKRDYAHAWENRNKGGTGL